jgi:hypothetical protein
MKNAPIGRGNAGLVVGMINVVPGLTVASNTLQAYRKLADTPLPPAAASAFFLALRRNK